MRRDEAINGKRRGWRACLGPLTLGAAIFSAATVSAQEVQPSLQTDTATHQQAPPAIVIGFVGGYVSRNSRIRSEVQLAERLRHAYPEGVHVETFENRRVSSAHQEILKLLANGQRQPLSEEEKRQARVILYGHSWGGTAAVVLARKLAKDGIPVLLTVQVDSVRRWSVDDSVIPANVAKAINFYQASGLLRGSKEIRAADPSHTQILGNFRYDYRKNPVECKGYPFWDRWFAKTHMEIECDPKVWDQVESLIRTEIGPPKHESAAN